MDPNLIMESPHRRKKSGRKSWTDKSPIDPMTDIARAETLLLTHFTKKPTICFGKVKVGKTLNRKLYVSNPHDYDQCVLIEKFPHDMNFMVDQTEFVVPGECTLSLNLTWTPANEGGCRQMIRFLVDESYRLQAVLYGTAELPRQKKVAKRGIMSKSVKKPFSILHTPNLANLKTYNTSMERETVLETPSVRRALLSPKYKSNQENRQPSKKSSLVMTKSLPMFQNGNSENQNLSEEFGIPPVSKSADLETKVRSSVKELYHISQPGTDIVSCVSYGESPEQHNTNYTVPVQDHTTVNMCEYIETEFSKQEEVTKIHAMKVNQWKASEEACQIESSDDMTEMQTFDYALRKKPKQCHKQSVVALSPRRETYLVKKHMSQRRRSWRNRISSPSVRATIPEMVNVAPTCVHSLVSNIDEPAKTASATANVSLFSPNFMMTSPIENGTLRNRTFQSEESSKNSGLDSSHNDGLELSSNSNPKERSAVMIDQLGKMEASPKSDDGMSTDSLNSKNSSASSVEALLTGKVDPATKKVLEASIVLMYDFRQATPSLPEKPNPQQVRRSTHVVKEPKIVCGQGKLKQKQLFSTGVDSTSSHDVSYVRPIDETKDLSGLKKPQVKTSSTARNSVTSRVRAAQKAVRITNREQLSQSVHEQFSRSQKLEPSEKSKSILTRSARTTVRTVKKTEITKSRKSCFSPKKCGVAQSRLVLGKREKTVIPKHPMPFASKNIYYDDRWKQKQEWSFTHWFNFILTPVDDYKLRNCPRVDAGSLVFNCKQDYHLAPTKEVLSFEAFAARRRLNRLRKLSCHMFQSADIVKVVRKVEVEIDSQRLVVRKDRPIHADIGLKQNILNWILCYNPLWLRIGLEMVFGEVLLIESNTDILGLSKFIITRLVGNPDLASQFAHPSVPHLYREGYQTALAKHTLKKFLILVYFLDYAKRHRLIEQDPCLFCKDSEIKASRDFLLNISRDFLSGEGDVTRHLAYFGYVVSYVQTPLDEFDYAVTNLATDLRDGVRLTRVVEILTGKWGLTKLLRAPAISRLQKIYNLEKVLKALTDRKMSLDLETGKICAKDIVDGHREKTLTLLWRIVTGFQVDILLNVKELEDEVACLNRILKRKMAIWKTAGVKSTFELNNRRSSMDLNKFENSKHCLLFAWCQAVCSHYGLKIENFTVSFSDGRVLCYLIHHYYPGLLRLSEINQNTTVAYINECESQQQDSDNSFDGMASSLHCSPRTGKPKIYQELLANEAENFKLIAVKVSQIGGVPTMLRHSDMSNTIPDEKVVITYVTYLAIRLLEIRHESRAAIVIQLAWRKYQLRKKQLLLKLKGKSHTPIANNAKILQQQSQTPDQSSPLMKQASISIKNALIPLAENSDDSHLGHSINDYSPIRPVDTEPLPMSAKKGKVLDTILESSTVESCISYRCDSQKLIGPLVDEKNISLDHKIDNIEAGDDASICQKLNLTMNLSDGIIRGNERSANLQNPPQAGDTSLNRPRGDVSAERTADNLTDSKGASSQLNKTMDLKDGSLLLKSDLPKASGDLCNETFNRERSALQSDLPNIDNSKIGINETFDGETCLQKSDSQSNLHVECKQMQNETFEKVCPQRSALNSTRPNIKPSSHDETFNNETYPPHESELLNSSVTKVECDDIQRNKTFDSDLSKPELKNILPSIDDYAVQENETIAEVTDSQKSNIPNLDEDQIDVNGTFEGEIQESNAGMGKAESEQNQRQTTESLYEENAQESLCKIDGEYDVLEVQHFQNEEMGSNDERPSFGCEEITGQLVLNQTVEHDDHFKGCLSEGPAVMARSFDQLDGKGHLSEGPAVMAQSFDHSQQNVSDGEPKPSEIDEQILDSHEEDNRIINLELNKTTEYKSEEAVESQSHEEDLFNDSCVCHVHNESVSFSKLNKTVEVEKSHDGSTSAILQSAEDGSHVENCLDIPCTVDSLQHSLTGAEGESKCDGAVFSDSQLQRPAFGEEEEWIEEEIILKMSRARTKEMIVDRESPDPSAGQKNLSANKAAQMIQNAFRRYAARKRFLSLKNSAIAIQRWYRRTREMRKACENYRSLKAATTIIQSTVRAYQERKRFLQKKKCILSLQQRRRALVAMGSARSEYLAKTAATKTIQRWYRSVTEMMGVKKDFERTRNAVVKIQSLVRRKNQQREFLQKKEATIFIQKWYQSVRMMQEARENYALVRKSTIQIQTLFRARRQRKWFMLEKESALRIQKAFRMFSARKRYLDCKNSAISIQQWYRCTRKMKKARQNYQDIKAATLVIQSSVRSHLVRKRFLMQKRCLISLQRRRRGLLLMRSTRTEYLAKRAAIKIIQRWYRAVTEMRKAKDDFQNTRKAIIKIQSLVRQRNKQREFLRKKNAVLCIQKRFRAVLFMKKERHQYVSLKNAATQIQALFRGHRQRKVYLLQQESALKIQSMFRKFLARKHYLCYKNSTITIQQWYRSTIETRKAHRNFESLRAATLVIQSTVKAYQERKRFLQKKNCVISLQQRRRAVVAMRIARTEYLAKKGASKTIQRWYREVKEMQKVRGDFEKIRNAVVKIQSIVRMRNQKKVFLKKKEAAICIQRWYRSVQVMQEARENYVSVRKATIQIQALFQACRQRKRFLLEKNSAIKIQDWYGGICSMRLARVRFLCMKSSAIKVQQAYKAYCLMRAERTNYLLVRSSIITLQSQTRMVLARRQFLKQKHSAVIIQKWYCSINLVVKEMNVYRSKKLAAVKLQSVFRGYLQRKLYLEKRRYIISAQSVVRMWIARRKWLVMRRAAVLIQKNYRSRLALQRLRETIRKRHEAATCIQLWFRKKLISRHQKRWLKIDCDCCTEASLMKTKKYADVWLEKTRRRKLNAVYLLQKYWHKWLRRRNHAATKIQSIVRGWLARRRLIRQTSAAIVIQKSLRGWHATRTFQKKKQAATKIQSCLRRYIVRRQEATYLLQRVIRGWFVRNRIKKWSHSATLIQSFWRGYKIRCSARRPVTALRKRLVDVTKKATDDKKLSNRFALGFEHLMKYKQLSEVLHALVNLEVASRLSPVCCVQLAEGNAAPVIFTIIRGCNRSVPHMELIKYSVQILLNLAKYAPTIEAVYDSHPDAIDIILNVMMVFREKGLVFSKSCILLGIIALDLHEKGKLDILISKPQFKERILSLYKLTERKYKREESRVTTRARMVAVKDSAVFSEFSMAADLAKIGPDFLLGKKILRETKEPLKAMTYLLNCLNLQAEVQQITRKKTRASKQ